MRPFVALEDPFLTMYRRMPQPAKNRHSAYETRDSSSVLLPCSLPLHAGQERSVRQPYTVTSHEPLDDHLCGLFANDFDRLPGMNIQWSG